MRLVHFMIRPHDSYCMICPQGSHHGVVSQDLSPRFWVALGMLMHFALTMLWRLAKAGFRPRLRVHSLKANGGHIASIRS